MERQAEAVRRHDRGFTLVELLVVIVVLGVLATVVAIAVGGLVESGDDESVDADERTLVTALEAYRAMHGSYPTEPSLVSAGMLRAESEFHDVTLNPDGTYTLVAVSP